MKVIIAGSRTFDNYDLLCETMAHLLDDGLARGREIEIVCGGAKGADALGARWAKEFNYPIKYFLADWNKYGKAAGIIRNKQMGDYADYLIAFWDGKSRGTKHMIEYMKNVNKHGTVIIC